ncbi:DUF551 domain-containing protein [Lachnospira multipara]|uniref:DUF551 domain-containing protein n=1 Tax=Lachnospira multipara TaxID=28051 RepID=UPI0004814332|nr:DUF551 domain-containing protein [Lachnospira multipara]
MIRYWEEDTDTEIGIKKQESCEDIMTIHTQGLDEEIRCTMCTNSMKSDRGCDGGCMIDEDMYKKVMDIIRNRIVSSTTPTRKKGEWITNSEQPRWIPVNERLPKPQKDNNDFSDWVQVSIKIDLYHSIVCSARYCFYTKRWCAERGGYCKVEAWQPLPEPYKAESEGE